MSNYPFPRPVWVIRNKRPELLFVSKVSQEGDKATLTVAGSIGHKVTVNKHEIFSSEVAAKAHLAKASIQVAASHVLLTTHKLFTQEMLHV